MIIQNVKLTFWVIFIFQNLAAAAAAGGIGVTLITLFLVVFSTLTGKGVLGKRHDISGGGCGNIGNRGMTSMTCECPCSECLV